MQEQPAVISSSQPLEHSKEPVIRMIYIAKAMNPLYIHTICLGKNLKGFGKRSFEVFHC